MKALYIIVLLGIILVLLCGCPYESAVGIDEKAGIPIKTQLLGTWHTAGYPGDSTEIKFTKSGQYQYLVQANTKNEKGGYELSHYRCWFSKINNTAIMSFYEAGNKFYYFAEVNIAADKLSVKFLSDEITKEQFTSTAAMRKFLETLYQSGAVEYDTDAELEDLIKLH